MIVQSGILKNCTVVYNMPLALQMLQIACGFVAGTDNNYYSKGLYKGHWNFKKLYCSYNSYLRLSECVPIMDNNY